jgi:hypothetical protein
MEPIRGCSHNMMLKYNIPDVLAVSVVKVNIFHSDKCSDNLKVSFLMHQHDARNTISKMNTNSVFLYNNYILLFITNQ